MIHNKKNHFNLVKETSQLLLSNSKIIQQGRIRLRATGGIGAGV